MLKNWNYSRVIRVVLGVYLIGDGIRSEQWAFIGLGALFLIMSAFNIGFCSANGCKTPTSKSTDTSNDADIAFEEVK